MSDGGLVDYGGYPEIEAHAMGDCYVIGQRVRFVMWDWYRIDGVWQRKITGTLTRPLAGLVEDQARSWQAIASVKAPSNAVAAPIPLDMMH